MLRPYRRYRPCLCRALQAAGAEAVIGMHEGVWHAFRVAPVPVARTARDAASAFIGARLR